MNQFAVIEPATIPPRVTVAYRNGKVLQIGCSHKDCQVSDQNLSFRDNGDIVFETRGRHNSENHWNTRSLREMVHTIAEHDLGALAEMLGRDLIQKLAKKVLA